MRYLLDSDAISDLYDSGSDGHPAMAAKLASLSDSDEVFISILAIYELEYGFAHAPSEIQPILRKRIEDVQSDFSVLPLTPQAARLFGALKAGLTQSRGLKPKGSKGHNIDLMIAASAIAEGCTLVSNDSIYPDLQELDHSLSLEGWATSERS